MLDDYIENGGYPTAEQIEYILIMDRAAAADAIAHIQSCPEWALDLETTSLSPKTGYVRLTQVSNDEVNYVFDHHSCGTFEELAPKLIGPTYYAFSASFEMKWFDAVVPEAIVIRDVQLMRVSKMGGSNLSLARQAKMDLGIEMNKDMQVSDWGQPKLSERQVGYAAYDAYVTWQLKLKWEAEMNAGHWRGFEIMNDVWRGNNEMEATALRLNSPLHMKNIKVWTVKRDCALRYFRRYTPESMIPNPRSNKQMSNFLKRELSEDTIANWPKTAKSGDLQLDRNTMRQAAFRLPAPMNRWLAAFIVYRYWNKYLSTYGDALITRQATEGKITSRFNVAAAITGRYSSSNANLQNIPRKAYIRRAFWSPPHLGDTMVLADYSGIEVRVLAEVSDDAQLKQDAIYGDVHMSAAAAIEEIPEEEFVGVLEGPHNVEYYRFKEMRNRAKVFNFRLTYGAGIAALSISLKKSDEETQEALSKWIDRYPRAYDYRHKMAYHMNKDGFIPIVDGRTVYVPKDHRSGPVAANYPIQGAAASVMYRAIYRTREEYLKHDVDAVLAATVHDELLSYAKRDCAEEALACKIRGMKQGWLDIFPKTDIANLMDFAIGDDWSAKP